MIGASQDKTFKSGHIVFLYEVGVQTNHISQGGRLYSISKCPNVAATWLGQPAGSCGGTTLVTRCGFCSYFLGSWAVRMYEQFVCVGMVCGDPDVEQPPTQLEARRTGSTLAPFATWAGSQP
ncbi:hypothetical protein B0H13DRAFT_1891037 [Mycena leptocephala]|nr:hypothetical protein B0H13DRAFT_1891037 [Mycena leptocephala]